MLKRFISIGLCLVLALGMTVTSFGAPVSFSDITDKQTARDVEVLRLMGVIEGYEDGTFKPSNSLTRAQFCKMAICIAGREQEASKYSNITVFPDVRSNHWAYSYINMAAKGMGIIAGFDDGLFRPNQPITSGQAVTILLRILGYKDEYIGGIWPDSYMNYGQSAGLLEGCGFTGGKQTITRAQAARLFVNMLTVEGHEGSTLYTVGEKTVLKSISPDTNKMNLSNESYVMVNQNKDSILVGMSGRPVFSGKDKILTFIPSEESTGLYDGVAVASADGSVTGFEQLSGGAEYDIYRDGVLSSADEIKKWDVATYNPQTRAMRLCSTRMVVYYEDCKGSPKAPDTITIMGGREYEVIESGKASVGQFHPGEQMIVLFTIDGQIAGAVSYDVKDARPDIAGEVDKNGVLTIPFCGDELKIDKGIDPKYVSREVKVKSFDKDGITLIALGEGSSTGKKCFAKVEIESWDGTLVDKFSGEQEPWTFYDITFNCGPNELYNFPNTSNSSGLKNNLRVVAQLSKSGESFSWWDELEALIAVPNKLWMDKKAVTYGAGTYEINEDTVYYNLDTESWSTQEKCLEYSTMTNMYVYEGVVRIVEFSAE